MRQRLTDSLMCVECGERSDAAALGWEAHIADVDDDGLDEVLLYCPACAEHEFHV